MGISLAKSIAAKKIIIKKYREIKKKKGRRLVFNSEHKNIIKLVMVLNL